MKVKLIKSQDWSEWDRFVKEQSSSSLYHTLEWKNILEATFGYEARFLAACSGSTLVDILPLFLVKLRGLGKKLICIPQSGFYPAFLSGHYTARNLLIEAAIKMANSERVRYLEIRSNSSVPELAEHNFVIRHPYNFPHLKLLDVSQNYKLLLHAHKKNIATAKRNGVIVELSRDRSCLLKFYAMMEEMYRDYGTPIFPYSYLSNMWDELVPKGHFFFLIVKHKDNLIGGGCFHHYHDTITFKYGCCLKAFSPMRPYNALTWKGITHGIDNGARHFNFGATSIKDEGLLFFKKGWGAEKGKAFFYYLPIKGQPPKMEAYLDSFQWIKKIWRRLPKPMLRLVGPYFYKWIC